MKIDNDIYKCVKAEEYAIKNFSNLLEEIKDFSKKVQEEIDVITRKAPTNSRFMVLRSEFEKRIKLTNASIVFCDSLKENIDKIIGCLFPSCEVIDEIESQIKYYDQVAKNI